MRRQALAAEGRIRELTGVFVPGGWSPAHEYAQPPDVRFTESQRARMRCVDYYMTLEHEAGRELPRAEKNEVIRLGRHWAEARAEPLPIRETMQSRRNAMELAAEVEEELDGIEEEEL